VRNLASTINASNANSLLGMVCGSAISHCLPDGRRAIIDVFLPTDVLGLNTLC
jgi:hypothetical protein